MEIICRGRGHDTSSTGVITDVYNSVFIYVYEASGLKFRSSYTYSDVITGEIEIIEID